MKIYYLNFKLEKCFMYFFVTKRLKYEFLISIKQKNIEIYIIRKNPSIFYNNQISSKVIFDLFTKLVHLFVESCERKQFIILAYYYLILLRNFRITVMGNRYYSKMFWYIAWIRFWEKDARAFNVALSRNSHQASKFY